jgi:hypothetical protein
MFVDFLGFVLLSRQSWWRSSTLRNRTPRADLVGHDAGAADPGRRRRPGGRQAYARQGLAPETLRHWLGCLHHLVPAGRLHPTAGRPGGRRRLPGNLRTQLQPCRAGAPAGRDRPPAAPQKEAGQSSMTGFTELLQACLQLLAQPLREVPYQPRPSPLWRVPAALTHIRRLLANWHRRGSPSSKWCRHRSRAVPVRCSGAGLWPALWWRDWNWHVKACWNWSKRASSTGSRLALRRHLEKKVQGRGSTNQRRAKSGIAAQVHQRVHAPACCATIGIRTRVLPHPD